MRRIRVARLPDRESRTRPPHGVKNGLCQDRCCRTHCLRVLAWRTLPANRDGILHALPDGRVLECESARAAQGGVQGVGQEARHGEVLRSFRIAGRFAARSDWQADLDDFEREVDRDVRTNTLDDQGGTGAEGEAKRPISEQCGCQARRHKASAVNFYVHLSRFVNTGRLNATYPFSVLNKRVGGLIVLINRSEML